jgi:alanine or glycine:cation symporter, AGCS family
MRNSPLARGLLLAVLVAIFFLLQTDISFADVVADAASKDPTFADKIDKQFGTIVGLIAPILFWEVPGLKMPFIVLFLLLGSVFFTIYHGFLNFKGFKHAIDITRGKYDNPNDEGEISHFQALTSALSATVGLGNIAGVAVAVGTGGPGAVFWMMLLGFFGMSAKLHECTLAQLYRQIEPSGVVHGGPMYYLKIGLKEKGLAPLGNVLAYVFAVFCILGSFGGGNMFQANQCFAAIKAQIPALGSDNASLIFGLVLAALVGLVIIGGIKKIGQVTEKIIPLMCGIYLVAGLIVVFANFAEVPKAISLIISGAFTPEAAFGGFIGVLVQGIKRAVFSNEAGVGSAAIAHSAAKTDEPAREGMVAMLGPFIDTVVICAMTGIILVVTGAYAEPAAGKGVEMTRWAFSQTMSWFPWVLAISIFLFAYSTMISWSYYGEKAWNFIFGRSKNSTLIYRVIFLVFVVIGTVSSLGHVIDFSDLMILSMAFPNIIGGIILAPKVKEKIQDYWARYQNNEFKVYK